MSSSSCALISNLGADLLKECMESVDPSVERCKDILKALEEGIVDGNRKKSKEGGNSMMSIAVLKTTQIGKSVSKSLRAMKRFRRSATSSSSSNDIRGGGVNDNKEWEDLVTKCEGMLSSWKDSAATEAKELTREKRAAAAKAAAAGPTNGLPTSVSTYHSRLTRQKKEMYKDPPVLPPPLIVMYDTKVGLPTRHKKTDELVFPAAAEEEEEDPVNITASFRPNLSPEQVLRGGAFGGTYFRPITSAVTNIPYKSKDVIASSVHPAWISGLNTTTYITSSTYRASINKFKKKCGGSLGMWESSGWISDADPYGWFQWYCRYYQGRRTSDDTRQISRWAKVAGAKGRFKSQLCNKILKDRTTASDTRISPVIRQTLWHWGLEVTEDILQKHRKRVEGK